MKNAEERTQIQLADVTPELPQQTEFYKIPARFGNIPVDEAPLGFEVVTRPAETKVTKFEHAYPKIILPFQEVNRIKFGHSDKFEPTNLFPDGANRLFFGDNLHIMRQLPSNSIDLIYIDPPFFSGRNYNVIFGDKNEMRSFSDIWEDGMPGYLIWLNARLYEMKRLLKNTGSIYVHLDWHASHYVKVEMDKIFGYKNFQNEIVWYYKSGGATKERFSRKHDILLLYTKSFNWIFNPQKEKSYMMHKYGFKKSDFQIDKETGLQYSMVYAKDVWEIPSVGSATSERIGYPTQKPEPLLEKLILASTNEGDIVADFFGGGGTTASVAQRLNRRWLTSDQSRIAVSVIMDRLTKVSEGQMFEVPDFTVEHCGIYEVPKLEQYSEQHFREFVIKCYGGQKYDDSSDLHGTRQGVPLYVGSPSRNSVITKDDVAKFAKAIFEIKHTHTGTMLGWNFDQTAKKAAEILKARENVRVDFVRLELVRLEDDAFKAHITEKHEDYKDLLSFIQPPEIKVNIVKIGKLTYRFDVSESVSLNPDGKIANVQWDFNYNGKRFRSTDKYNYLRDKKGNPILIVEYEFPKPGEKLIACSVQDNQGGEKTEILKLDVK
ncbi:MAG: Mtase protein [Ignavibacteria bacterium]|nr:Mtase protein [Ignavibacteria bacterium]